MSIALAAADLRVGERYHVTVGDAGKICGTFASETAEIERDADDGTVLRVRFLNGVTLTDPERSTYLPQPRASAACAGHLPRRQPSAEHRKAQRERPAAPRPVSAWELECRSCGTVALAPGATLADALASPQCSRWTAELCPSCRYDERASAWVQRTFGEAPDAGTVELELGPEDYAASWRVDGVLRSVGLHAAGVKSAIAALAEKEQES